ncbi:ABC transporter permease [Litorilinea aerophila]|uniref:ABC transporter permease n=1 Tax=Litorilinea aerophila TaxID=1204385 RepID=A0A540VI30_9CHLR|nr:ABC transporter permease [Litorilinea aerophila]MCC9076076.1 ABC transporter permease [Litorilinea aerophila]
MSRYLVQRLQHLAWVLFAVSLLVFLLIYLSGDPATLLAPLDAKPEDVARIRQLYGLDQPILVQYWRFLVQAVQGDLGESFRYHQPALTLVLQKLPATVQLALFSLGLTVLVGIPLGVLAGTRPNSLVDWIASLITFVGISIPSFWLGILLILAFADRLRWLPSSGAGTWRHLLLPGITLSLYSIGLVSRLVRSTLIDVLQHDYIRTARAKGLGERLVLYRHALRNTLIPTVTVLGLQLGGLLGGSVVVESVFAWPGVGWLMLQGIQNRDLPLVRAVVLVVGLAFVLINLTVDLIYTLIDPRIRHET